MNNNPFTLTDALVTIGFLVAGLLIIFYFNDREMKRLKRKEENRYPSATRKYSKEVEKKLRVPSLDACNRVFSVEKSDWVFVDEKGGVVDRQDFLRSMGVPVKAWVKLINMVRNKKG